jgi:hypothetical protein
MNDRCASCPVEPGKTCVAADHPDRFGHWCELARAGKPLDLKMIVGRSELPVVTAPGRPRLPAVESIRLTALMKACPHWVKRTDCGCGVNQCRLGKGKDGLVRHADCFACLQRPDVGSGPPAA